MANPPSAANPVINPPIPYIGQIANGIAIDQDIKIQGSVPQASKGFKIGLLCGADKLKDDISLLMDVDISTKKLTFSSRTNGEWSKQQGPPEFPFKTGQNFLVGIKCIEESYTISVDARDVWQFLYPNPNLKLVTHMYIVPDRNNVAIERIDYPQ